MADSDRGFGGNETARLEAALERIALAAARPATVVDAEAEAARAARMTAMAGRLDALIAELREVLGSDDAATADPEGVEPAADSPLPEDSHAPFPVSVPASFGATGDMASGVTAGVLPGSAVPPGLGQDPADPN